MKKPPTKSTMTPTMTSVVINPLLIFFGLFGSQKYLILAVGVFAQIVPTELTCQDDKNAKEKPLVESRGL